jgi:hypothetical protein
MIKCAILKAPLPENYHLSLRSKFHSEFAQTLNLKLAKAVEQWKHALQACILTEMKPASMV